MIWQFHQSIFYIVYNSINMSQAQIFHIGELKLNIYRKILSKTRFLGKRNDSSITPFSFHTYIHVFVNKYIVKTWKLFVPFVFHLSFFVLWFWSLEFGLHLYFKLSDHFLSYCICVVNAWNGINTIFIQNLLTLILLELKMINLCHQYTESQASLQIGAVWPDSILLANQPRYP